AVEAGVPVGIPVVVERTAHTPGLDRLLSRSVRKHRVGSSSERYALVGTSKARAAIDRDTAELGRQILDVVAGCTVGIHARNVDRVTGARRNVLEGEAHLTSPAPLVVGMSGRLGRTVIGGTVVMRRERRLEQTPRLVDLHRRDDVGNNRAGVVACTK